jgi:hypothetical protein
MYMSTEQLLNTQLVLNALIEHAKADGADWTPELYGRDGVLLQSMPLSRARAALLNVQSQLAIDGEELAA